MQTGAMINVSCDITLIRGAAFRRQLSSVATGGAVAPVWATTPATFVLDGPNGQRITFNWRPAGTSSVYITNDTLLNTLQLFLPTTWTAVNLTPGQWNLGILFLDPTSSQIPVGIVTIFVQDLENGPAPVVA